MADKITYEEFLEMAKPHAAGPADHHYAMYDDELKQFLDDSSAFFEKWVTGGREGGSPWNDGLGASYFAEREPDLRGLYEVFDRIGISYWKGRKIEWDVKDGHYTDSGYYGSYTEYAYKWISFEAVYDRLVEFGMAHPREQAPRPGK
jgi:hypothetical protein